MFSASLKNHHSQSFWRTPGRLNDYFLDFYTFPMNWLRRQHPFNLYLALIVAFVLVRFLFFAITTAGEYRLYQDYGDAARRTSLDELYRNRDIEYPQLGVAFGSVVGFVADHFPEWTKHVVRLRPNKWEEPYTQETEPEHDAGDRYEAALTFVLFVLDAWCLWLVHAIARRVYPNDDAVARVGRLLKYVITTSTCGLILYDRQDLVVGWLALLALWALANGRPRLGYALLALGTAYKLVPVLLMPIWVMAAATAKCGPNAGPKRFLRMIILEAAIAGLILAAWPVLTYAFGGGERGFLYLTWHSKRGLQLEAPAAFPVLLADPSSELGASYGSFNLRGDLADRTAKLMALLMPLSALAGMALAAKGFWRTLRKGTGSGLSDYRQLIPHVVASSLLIWVAFIAFNKVGSPQYLIWVAPLVPLFPLRTWSERGWALVLLVAMIATMLIYPCRYKPDLIGDIIRNDPDTWRGPTSFGVFLLGVKSVTLVLSTVWLAVLVWRTADILPETPPSSEPKP